MHTCMYLPTTAPVTKSGDTMLGLAVCEGQLDIIKYLVTECSVSVNGEHVSPAICGHMYTCRYKHTFTQARMHEEHVHIP